MRYEDIDKAAALEEYNSGKSVNSIAVKFGCGPHQIKRVVLESGTKLETRKHRKYTVNNSFFDVIDSEEKAYWLGFLYADGCIYKENVNLLLTDKESEIEHLNKYKTSLQATHRIEQRVDKVVFPNGSEKMQKSAKVRIRSSQMVKSLIAAGCVPRKSFVIRFPDERVVKRELQRHFIRGYFDGDGSVWNSQTDKYSKWGFNILGNDEFIRVMSDVISSYGIHGIIKPHPSKGISRYILSSQLKMTLFRDFIYKDSSIYLQRKYDKFHALPAKYFVNTAEKIKSLIESSASGDFSVKSPIFKPFRSHQVTRAFHEMYKDGLLYASRKPTKGPEIIYSLQKTERCYHSVNDK